MHSVTAKTVGVSRDNAKILNYGRIYGAGVSFAKDLLLRFNPNLDEKEAKKLATQMYLKTKGEREYKLTKLGAFFHSAVNNVDPTKPELWQSPAQSEDTINLKQLYRIVKFKRKMDFFFRQADPDDPTKWVFKDESIECMLTDAGYIYDHNENIPLSKVSEPK